MIRQFDAPDFHQRFDTKTGRHAYWGITKEVNPEWCPYGPNILDIEISSGRCHGNCKFCYKSNGLQHNDVENMTLETFKEIFKKLNRTVLTQIAFGICDIETNPDMWKIFEHCRSENIIPNFTCNGLGITVAHAEAAARLCGAVAVSLVNKDHSYNAIRKFTEAGMKQVNIHFMLSKETYSQALTLIDDIKNDLRLSGLNAVVFLQYKPKGQGVGHFSHVSLSEYEALVDKAMQAEINIGFDSCSAPMFLKYLDHKDDLRKAIYVEPCESGLFSGYLNARGEFFPCSFAEGIGPDWETGISVLEAESFQDIWTHPRTKEWRNALTGSTSACGGCRVKDICRRCTLFTEVTPCLQR